MTTPLASTDTSPQTLLFIDENAGDVQSLVTGVSDGVKAIVLEKDRNGIEQIATEIQKFAALYGAVEALHIFSHGNSGSLLLGNSTLSSDNLEQYRSQLQQWGDALSENAGIVLYGCNVATGTGADFVSQLSQITGAEIAASTDFTGSGSSAAEADWDLEFSTGEIEAPLAFKPAVMAEYSGVLGGVVGTGTPESVTEAALKAALAGGGTITFNTGGVPVTINLSSELAIDAGTVIDGGGLVTLSGGGATRVIRTEAGTNVTLKNLTIANGKVSSTTEAGAGAGIQTGSSSTLTVDNCLINNNIASYGGGGIFTGFRSTTTVINSQFNDNDGTAGKTERGGGAIATKSEGTLTVQNTQFSNNKGINGGAINSLLSQLTVENSTFLNNNSTAGSSGGGTSGYGGAIYTDGASALANDSAGGAISIRNSRFEGNIGAGQGGGMFLFTYPPDSVTIENSTIINNQVIKNASGNALGGGIRQGNGNLTITNTTIANNSALSQGGGLWVGESSPVTINNSTFSGNKAQDSNGTGGLGGGLFINNGSSSTNIVNATLANNYAGAYGGAIFSGDQQKITLTNTITANNTAGNAFNINQQTNRQLIEGGNNLEFPGPLTTDPKDVRITANVTVADPLLGPLQDNGGPTPTHALLAGSPAINAGGAVSSLAADQRGVSRTDGIDIGAFEFAPAPPAETIFTPNDDTVLLTEESDSADALAGNDLVIAFAGNDTLFGNLGNDTLFGNQGNDILIGYDSNEILYGGKDNDILFGNQGADFLYGELGDDTLFAGKENDSVIAGDGSDLLYGDLGNDTLTGDAGSDRFVLKSTNGSDTITDFTDGQDLISLADGLTFNQLSISAGAGVTLINIASSGELLASLNGIQSNNIGVEDFVVS